MFNLLWKLAYGKLKVVFSTIFLICAMSAFVTQSTAFALSSASPTSNYTTYTGTVVSIDASTSGKNHTTYGIDKDGDGEADESYTNYKDHTTSFGDKLYDGDAMSLDEAFIDGKQVEVCVYSDAYVSYVSYVKIL
jgi:hypothetical protein